MSAGRRSESSVFLLWLNRCVFILRYLIHNYLCLLYFRSTQNRYVNPEEVVSNAYDTTKENGYYSSIEVYDNIDETSEGYTELNLVATKKQESPDDIAPLPEEQTTSAVAPELPPLRQHVYMELIP